MYIPQDGKRTAARIEELMVLVSELLAAWRCFG